MKWTQRLRLAMQVVVLLALAGASCGRSANGPEAPVQATATLPPPPTQTAQPAATATAAPSATAAATQAPTPVPATATLEPAFADGKVVGVFTAAESELPTLASYGVNTVLVVLEPETAVSYLEAAEQAGLRIIANLVKKPKMMDQACVAAASQRPSCPFDPEAFRAALEAYRPLNLERFAGTSFFAHIMLDEPFDASGWGGSPISAEDLRAANAYSKEILGKGIPTLFNAGGVPPGLGAGLADYVTSTFYANKEARFGSLEAYVADQLGNMAGALREQPDLKYIVILQAVGGGEYGRFPAPEAMEAKALAACGNPRVSGVMWWTWHKDRTPEDFSHAVAGPDGQAYIDMLGRVAQACGNDLS